MLGEKTMFMVDFFCFSLKTDAFSTWSCNTLILHRFMSCIATNDYACAPRELKPFASQQEMRSSSLRVQVMKKNNPTTNPQENQASVLFVCRYFSIVFSTNCQTTRVPYYSVIMQLITQKSLSSSPSKQWWWRNCIKCALPSRFIESSKTGTLLLEIE